MASQPPQGMCKKQGFGGDGAFKGYFDSESRGTAGSPLSCQPLAQLAIPFLLELTKGPPELVNFASPPTSQPSSRGPTAMQKSLAKRSFSTGVKKTKSTEIRPSSMCAAVD